MSDNTDLEAIAEEEASEETDGGQTSVANLILSRQFRKAAGAIGLILMGASAATATSFATSDAAIAQTSTGSGTVYVSDIVANDIDTDTLDTQAITGIAGDVSEINEIAGNIRVGESLPSDTSDHEEGDIFIELSEGTS